jgi:hypothetical protein
MAPHEDEKKKVNLTYVLPLLHPASLIIQVMSASNSKY